MEVEILPPLISSCDSMFVPGSPGNLLLVFYATDTGSSGEIEIAEGQLSVGNCFGECGHQSKHLIGRLGLVTGRTQIITQGVVANIGFNTASFFFCDYSLIF